MAEPDWPPLAPCLPQHCHPASQRFGRWLLRRLGWSISGQLPAQPKMVIAVAPHTSNWDFFIAMAAGLALGVKVSFLGKHSIFIWPVRNWLLRWGGIPVNRKQSQGVVGQLVQQFQMRPQLVLGIAPEGTRKKTKQWKSGFWNIAQQAGVPIQLLGLDFATKQLVFGPLLDTSADYAADLELMRLFFNQMTAKHPENV